MQAGFDVRLAVDVDRQSCETYARNLGEKAIWQVDLSEVQPEQLLEKARIGQSEVDLIVGGPPCQGFSSAGAKDWTDPRNKLLRNFIEVVTKLRPTWFVMENVDSAGRFLHH
jgi:DNA (cytosine-5)-methyltransferase 1